MKTNCYKLFLLFLLLRAVSSAQNWSQIVKSVASDRETKVMTARSQTDFFGISIAFSGNYAVVGASGEDQDSAGVNTVLDRGAAYVLYNDSGNWVQVKKLAVPGSNGNLNTARFGNAVAISGDYIIVGSYLDDTDVNGTNFLNNAGSAYIFKKDQGGSGNWGLLKKLTASVRGNNHNFGFSVAILGDYALVGAYRNNTDSAEANPLTDAGAAYVFKKDNGGTDNWGLLKKITPSVRAANDRFGYSISMNGDEAVIGASRNTTDAAGGNSLAWAGAAYIVYKDQGGTDNWGIYKKMVPLVRHSGDQFGSSVSMSANSIIVGAPTHIYDLTESIYTTSTEAGGAFIFARDSGGINNWGQVQKVISSVRQQGARFGSAVSTTDNIAVVGSYRYEYNYSLDSAGTASLFEKNGSGTWDNIKTLFAPTSIVRSQRFGYGVAISDSTLLISAPGETLNEDEQDGAYGAGGFFYYTKNEGGTNNWGYRQKKVMRDRNPNDWYGYAVSISGEYAAVSALHEDEDTAGHIIRQDVGAVYMLHHNAGNWEPVKKILEPNTHDPYFGDALALSGDYLIVGNQYNTTDSTDANPVPSFGGGAYIFQKDLGGVNNWGLVKKFTLATLTMGDCVGLSVGISGDYAIVSSLRHKAYILKKDKGGTNNWGLLKTLNLPGNGTSGANALGVSVSISGDYAAVGFGGMDTVVVFQKDLGGTDNWGLVRKFTESPQNGYGGFGVSVAISGDYLVVGSKQDDDSANETAPLSEAGSAYIFRKDAGGPDNWGLVKKICPPFRHDHNHFGSAVAIDGDYIVVGAIDDAWDAANTNPVGSAGASYIFKKNLGGTDNWGFQQKVLAPFRAAYDEGACSVAISQNRVIMGAYKDDEDATEGNYLDDAGAAYIFTTCPPLAISSQPLNDTVCAGTSAALQVSASEAFVYQWEIADDTSFSTILGGGTFYNSNASSFSFSPGSADTLFIRCVLHGGCGLMDTSDTVSLLVLPLPVVLGSSDTTMICAGGEITLTGTGNADAYTWSGGAIDGIPFSPAVSSIYIVTGTDISNCSNTDTVAITVITLPDISVNVDSILLTANQNSASYQWLDCNAANTPVFGETGQSFDVQINGSYAVAVSMNGCADTSSCTTISFIGIHELSNIAAFSVYPNPAPGQVIILSSIDGEYQLSDELGRIVRVFRIEHNRPFILDTSALENGVYAISFATKPEIHQKIIILK
jgi:hypothetical protein